MADQLNPGLLVDDMPFPLLVVRHPDFRVVWVNTYAENWFGRSRKSLAGRDLTFLTKDTDSLIISLEKARGGRPVNIHDLRVFGSGDASAPFFISAFPHGDDVAIMMVPSEQRTPKTGQDSSNAVSALGRMLAHELKNPLAGIKGAAQLLKSEHSGNEDLELIALIGTETDRIRRLADRMESFAAFDEMEPGPVNIHSVLRQARLLAQSSPGNKIRYIEDYDPSLPNVDGDTDALMQVAINLIGNAAEAISLSSTGGTVRLETAYRTGLSRQTDGPDRPLPIEIRIVDDGPGISAAVHEQMFMPFVTDKPAGRGLGLTLVSRIISAHGGVIDVTSKPGRTVFSLSLPAADNKDAAL